MTLYVLKLIPKNLVSFVTGLVVRIRFPGWLAPLPLGAFVRLFRINMSEAAQDLAQFRSIEDVFIRKLKPTARPVHSSLCSPADGIVTSHGPYTAAEAVQVKGITYRLQDLVFGDAAEEVATSCIGTTGWYQTIYLAPHNYHRVHSPVSGQIEEIRYIPGTLWPVNAQSVRLVPGLFAKNERLTFMIATELGVVAVVMVGAFNVGRIVAAAHPGLCTNDARGLLSPRHRQFRPPAPIPVKAGEELGVFMLGSTVVSVFPSQYSDRHQFLSHSWGQPIKMGEAIVKI